MLVCWNTGILAYWKTGINYGILVLVLVPVLHALGLVAEAGAAATARINLVARVPEQASAGGEGATVLQTEN